MEEFGERLGRRVKDGDSVKLGELVSLTPTPSDFFWVIELLQKESVLDEEQASCMTDIKTEENSLTFWSSEYAKAQASIARSCQKREQKLEKEICQLQSRLAVLQKEKESVDLEKRKALEDLRLEHVSKYVRENAPEVKKLPVLV